MPELPEVETIRSDLAPLLTGRSFSGVEILDPLVVRQPSPEEFTRNLASKGIVAVERRGKYLIIRLSSGDALILHFRMTGVLLLNPDVAPPHARAIFHLDNGDRLVFSDRRRLGKMWLVRDAGEVVGKLGPEPLATGFTSEVLAERLGRRPGAIKAVLCDQDILAGVGNMYADEALFLAGIHPLRKASSLSRAEIERLYQAIRKVLFQGISDRGASVDTYRDVSGNTGEAQLRFKVAHRGGQPCPDCGTAIQRIPIRNRGSYFCPRCQKPENG